MTHKLPIKIDKGSGNTTLVLLHGLGTNHQSWKYVLDKIDYKAFRVIAFDLLGFGDAPKPETTYSLEVHAQAVIATLDTLGIKKAVIAGHSMGCLVALEVAKREPQLATHLLLLGAPLYKTIPKERWWKRTLKIEGVYFTIFNAIKRNPEAVIDGSQAAETLLPLLHGMEITEETWPAFKSSLEHSVMQTESYKTAYTLQTKTLVTYGILDIFVSKRNLKNIARHNRQYVQYKTLLGPHEITPLQGKKIASLLNQFTNQ